MRQRALSVLIVAVAVLLGTSVASAQDGTTTTAPQATTTSSPPPTTTSTTVFEPEVIHYEVVGKAP